MSDHYETLGVDKGATPAEIKKAWRRAASAAHPDREGGSTERMAAVNEAYDALIDPVKRIRYDQTGDSRFVAEQLARDTVASLFGRLLEERDDIDVVAAARRELDNVRANIEAERAAVKRRIANVEGKARRLKAQPGKPNIGEVIAQRIVADCRARLGVLDQDHEATRLAQQIVKAYTYDMTQARRAAFGAFGSVATIDDLNRAHRAFHGGGNAS